MSDNKLDNDKVCIVIIRILLLALLGLSIYGDSNAQKRRDNIFLISTTEYNFQYELENLQFEKSNNFVTPRIIGLEVEKRKGKPIIPVDHKHLIIPGGLIPESVNVKINSSTILKAEHQLEIYYPQKDSIYQNFYKSDDFYPRKKVRILGYGNLQGNRIVDILIYPLTYDSESHKLVFSSDITIKLFCSASTKIPLKSRERYPYSKKIMEKCLHSTIDNKIDIPAYSLKPTIKNNTKDDNSYAYLVITADSLKESFYPLTHWINRKGIKAGVISLDTILKYYSYDPISNIYDDAGAIRGFLLDEYTKGLQWVLLGGDEEIIPVRYGTTHGENDTEKRPPSDLYYSDLDGNWNVDGDTLYGEYNHDSVDVYPELFVGRPPANTKKEIENWVSKVLNYEKNPGNGNPSYLTKVFWTGIDELRNKPAYIIENGSFPPYFTHDTTMLEDSNGIHPRGSEVIDRMNNYYGWFNLYGHGAPDNQTVSCPGYNHPNLDRDFITSLDTCEAYLHAHHWGNNVESGNGLDSLKNKNFYGIMYISSCFQGAYDYENFEEFDLYYGPSIAEAFTLLPEKGGPAFIGFTRGIDPSTAIHLSLLEVIFEDSITNIGASEAVAKTRNYEHKTRLSHTLFGDPLMPVWTNIPKSLSASFIDSIPPETLDFDINVTNSGNPANDAYICLWKEKEVYSTGFTDGGGNLTLPINPETEGIMLLTITGENFYPYLDTIWVDSSASLISEKKKNLLPFCSIDEIISLNKVIFRIYMPESQKAKLEIFDLTGRRVAKLLDKKLRNGEHKLSWNLTSIRNRNLSSGIYFYRFHYKNQSIAGKFIILK